VLNLAYSEIVKPLARCLYWEGYRERGPERVLRKPIPRFPGSQQVVRSGCGIHRNCHMHMQAVLCV
jgi:hypothetical protein